MNNPSSASSPYTARLLEEKDRSAVCALFKKVFSEEMPEAFWEWKYNHPQGKGTVVFKDDQLVAHYGGIGTNILKQGENSTAIQITDVMVDPAVRHAVRKSSPFFIAGTLFLDNFIGYKNPYLLGYGFPSDRHMRLAEMLGMYKPVGKMWELTWPEPNFPTSFWQTYVQVTSENFESCKRKLNEIWFDFSHQLKEGIVCKKTSAYIKRRYLDHPTNEYRVYLVMNRFMPKVKGLLVLKIDEESFNQSRGTKISDKPAMIMDVMFSNKKELPKVISLAAQQAREHGHKSLQTWCSKGFLDWWQIGSPEQKELPITTPANVWTDGPSPEELKDLWWLMPGDTDYL